MKRVVVPLILIALIAVGIYLRCFQTRTRIVTGDAYILSPREVLKRTGIRKGFVDLIWQKEELGDGMILYRGKAIWNERSGAPGEPAIVPVQLLKVNRAEKKLEILQTFITGEDGSFFFLVPRGIEIIFAVRTERAVNMPPKVKEFFKQRRKS